MKATGIVRRIDDLGRVVIPKEIRRTLRIKEGTPLEIFTDREGEIILKKYSPIGELNVFAKEYAEALAQSSGMVACITDHDQVVAAAGLGSREYLGKAISGQLEEAISGRTSVFAKFFPVPYHLPIFRRNHYTSESLSIEILFSDIHATQNPGFPALQNRCPQLFSYFVPVSGMIYSLLMK